MSSSIWMQCAGDSEHRLLRLVPWRVVESQHEVSTRKLVDSADEQELLETLLERVKPPVAVGAKQHYLLFTPFRYPPLRHGSRFGSRQERGVWYGAESQRTALAEVAYYRLLFLEGTHAELGLVTTELTAFTVRMRSAHGIDLTAPPFAAHRDMIASPTSYAATQVLGREMREAGVELFRFPSARDTEGGVNVGAFTPAVFHAAVPQQLQRWHCAATRNVVDFTRGDLRRAREHHPFRRAQFEVDGRLPRPGI
jgi:hypothetical protein